MSSETSEADKAYKIAQDRIAKAAKHNPTMLDLAIEGLTTLPPEIANFAVLRYLKLDGTQVSDLSPISNLTALQELDLGGTNVSDLSHIANLTALRFFNLSDTLVRDLRPVMNHQSLISDHLVNGLYFYGSRATELDPTLAVLGEISNAHERTEKTFAYLETLPPWPQPLPWEKEFDPMSLPKLILTQDHVIDIVDETPDADDMKDDVARIAYEELQNDLPELNRFTNQYFELDQIYKRLAQLTADDFENLSILRLHLTITKLAGLQKENIQRSKIEQYSLPCSRVIDTILSLGPQITMGNAEVKESEKRLREFNNQELDKTRLETERKVTIALGANAELTTTRARDAIQDITTGPTSPQIETYRSGFLRNSFLLLARIAGVGRDAVAGYVAKEAAKFLWDYAPGFLAIATTWGSNGLAWVEAVMRQVRHFLGI